VVAENTNLTLTCPPSYVVKEIQFASFGTPTGTCGNYSTNTSCNSANSLNIVNSQCLGKNSCSIPATNAFFGGDPCPNVVKELVVQASCLPSIATSPTTSWAYQVNVFFPVGVTTSINLPLITSGSSFVLYDLITGLPIWQKGSYQSGVAGIKGAVVSGTTLSVSTASGSYTLLGGNDN